MSTASGDPLSLSFDILRRLPPSDVRVNVDRLMQVLPEYADDIASGVDQPLTVGVDPSPVGARREFLCCDYNRDGGSWRSWISNTWCPPLESTDEARVVPTGKLRELELHANEAFETYRKLAGEPDAHGTFGTWDSLHVIEVATAGAGAGAEGTFPLKSAHYSVSSTVMLTLNRHEGGTGPLGNVDMSGSLTRQTEETCKVDDASGHIRNLGRIIEDVEAKIRNQLQEIYFGKMHDVVDQLRSLDDLEASHNAKRLQQELVAGWER